MKILSNDVISVLVMAPMWRHCNVVCFLLAACASSGDVIFMLDASGSMGPDDFDMMLSLVKDIVVTMEIGASGAQVGLMQYSDDARVEFHLNENQDTESIAAAIGKCWNLMKQQITFLETKRFTLVKVSLQFVPKGLIDNELQWSR